MHHHLQCYSLGRMLVAYSEGAGNEVEKTSLVTSTTPRIQQITTMDGGLACVEEIVPA